MQKPDLCSTLYVSITYNHLWGLFLTSGPCLLFELGRTFSLHQIPHFGLFFCTTRADKIQGIVSTFEAKNAVFEDPEAAITEQTNSTCYALC